jgi:hypothetical protein
MVRLALPSHSAKADDVVDYQASDMYTCKSSDVHQMRCAPQALATASEGINFKHTKMEHIATNKL